MAGNKFERKRVWVNSVIQGRILTRVAAYWVIYHLVMWHTLFMFHYFQYRVEVLNGAPALPFAELYGTFCLKYYPIVLSAMACTPLLLGDVLKMTHRIAGPLYSVEKSMRAMIAGEKVEKVTIRDHDLLIEFRDEFNAFLKYHNELRDKALGTQSSLPTHGELTEEQLLENVQELQKSLHAQTTATAS